MIFRITTALFLALPFAALCADEESANAKNKDWQHVCGTIDIDDHRDITRETVKVPVEGYHNIKTFTKHVPLFWLDAFKAIKPLLEQNVNNSKDFELKKLCYLLNEKSTQALIGFHVSLDIPQKPLKDLVRQEGELIGIDVNELVNALENTTRKRMFLEAHVTLKDEAISTIIESDSRELEEQEEENIHSLRKVMKPDHLLNSD